jgi:transcriptional regulator with XRE-family HTH domain/uncharacterized cupin superfamily protein
MAYTLERSCSVPVFSSHLVDYKGLAVGQRLREERVRKRLTLRQVAAVVGFSEATLSNIETEKVAPDLALLGVLAHALEIPLATLLPRSHLSHYLVKRATELQAESPHPRKLIGPEPGPQVHHNASWSLADLFVGRHMDPVIAQVRPLADQDVHYIAHDHEEFMFVLRGSIQTLLKTNEGLVSEELHAGDCLYFRSNLPHCHRSLSGTAAETVNVMYSLRGPLDPSDGELDSSGRHFYRRGVYEDPSREAGEKIGLLRRSHGITLAELGREIGLGTRILAGIERGERPPDLDLLLKLSRRFRRPIEYFFATTLEGQPYYFVQRAANITHIPIQHLRSGANGAESDGRFRPLATGFPDRGVHPYYVQLPNAPPDPAELTHHHGQQFIHVLEGEMAFVTTGDSGASHAEHLYPGDSIFFDSSVPYACRGHSRNPYATAGAEVLSVFWTPLGAQYLFEDAR